MAAVLLAKGRSRVSVFQPANSRIMIHQPSMQGLAGQRPTSIFTPANPAHARDLNIMLAEATGQARRARRQGRVDRDYILGPNRPSSMA